MPPFMQLFRSDLHRPGPAGGRGSTGLAGNVGRALCEFLGSVRKRIDGDGFRRERLRGESLRDGLPASGREG